MKKNTKMGVGAETKAAKERKHGPQKEKVQVTLHIDKDLMDQAYAMIKDTNQRITDVVEQGLVLAMKAEDALPTLMTKVRFLVANATREQQEQILLFLSFLVLEELTTLTPPERLIRLQTFEYLKLLKKWRNETMHLYSRYGRTPDEVAAPTAS